MTPFNELTDKEKIKYLEDCLEKSQEAYQRVAEERNELLAEKEQELPDYLR